MNARALTPALARERARMGAMRARPWTVGGCGCGCVDDHWRGIGAIGDVGSDFTAALNARVRAQLPSVQAQLASTTGLNTNNARTAAGAQAAVSLAQNGYNPDSSDDNGKLVAVIAGGLALLPPPGDLLGGAVEALWQLGNVIACPVTNAFASIGLGTPCNAPPCQTSGSWSVASVLSGNQVPPMPQGSFASLAVPALAAYAVQAAECKGGFPGSVVVDAVVALWNRTHAGPAAPFLIPPIGSRAASSINPAPVAVSPVFMFPSVSGSNPWKQYGFGPASAALGWQAFWTPPAPSGMVWEPARTVLVNTGALIAPHVLTLHLGPPPGPTPTGHVLALHLGPAAATAAAAPSSSSSAGKVAAAAGAAGAGALAWWLASNGWKWRTPRWAGKLVR
jgi:hypothetical protein